MRYNDYSLSEDQNQLLELLRDLLVPEDAADRARDAEGSGFDEHQWRDLVTSRIVALAIDEADGGEGGGLVELALAAIEAGRGIAPVPIVEHMVATRALAAAARASAVVDEWAAMRDGSVPVSLAPGSTWRLGAELVPSGAVVTRVLAYRSGSLVMLERDEPPARAESPSGLPFAWWTDDEATRIVPILGGDVASAIWRTTQDEWRIAAAAVLTGMIDAVGHIASRYATEREAFGRQIARFQAVSHTLVGIHIAAQSTRNLVLKAAWLTEHDPEHRAELPAIAMIRARDAALMQTHRAVHVHGGFGITRESDVGLYFRRAAAIGLVAGGSAEDFDIVEGSIASRLRGDESVQFPAYDLTNK